MAKPQIDAENLALHLQKLYERLIDYEPTVDYGQRLSQLSRAVGTSSVSPQEPPEPTKIGTRGIWASLLAQKEKRDSLALTRVLNSHESALHLNSPKGFMLHGEVGTGKSMLIDLFADCLPTRKKRRWHFNTFMLETLSKLELLRKSRLSASKTDFAPLGQDDYSILWLARDMIQTSPILFLDEFQLPDRAASKIMSSLMTSFFQLGGVLIATSNRMPEELAKAAGMEFSRPPSRLESLGWKFGVRDVGSAPAQHGEFGAFLEVLRARCEVWEMEGKQDYRRIEAEGLKDATGLDEEQANIIQEAAHSTASGLTLVSQNTNPSTAATTLTTSTLPRYYFIQPYQSIDSIATSEFKTDFLSAQQTAINSNDMPIPWQASTVVVYGRQVPIPRTHAGTAHFTFSELCGTNLGPADYITLASTFHTLILVDIPILTLLQKNEARRLITLLDALYEARCRLLITAAADPDNIFFPSQLRTPSPSEASGAPSVHTNSNAETANRQPEESPYQDATHSETFSEAYQDMTSPFRPNITSYNTTTTLSADALEDDPPNRVRRTDSSFTDERRSSPDFGNVGALTGEDERFAVKRAESRLWEMCSGRWWDRGEDLLLKGSEVDGEGEGGVRARGWRPLPLSSRHWERDASASSSSSSSSPPLSFVPNTDTDTDSDSDSDSDSNFTLRLHPDAKSLSPSEGQHASRPLTESQDEVMFQHDASPFRTATEPPPKISWTHVWGTMRWGKKAGAWGKGVEGLEERKREKGKGKGKGDGGEGTRK